MFLLVLSYYVALYSLIFEIAEVVFAGHKADPGTSPTGTLSANSLELKQRVAYDRFVDHCEVWSHHAAHGDRCANNPLMVHMDGEGGTITRFPSLSPRT
jgi:hypothetical protein